MDTTTKTAAPRQHLSKQQWISRSAFCFGNVGHSAFYGVMSNYFIIFVTSGMFAGLSKSVANRLIGLITGLIVGVRIIELVIDPLLGNIVDNTHTRWGKFKPWILWGNIVSGALLLVLFTGIFGLAKVNWILFAILFVVIFITFDIFYSFSDVSYWGMVPALSEDSHERSIYTSLGAFAGTIGWNGLTIIVVPIVTTFTYLATGHRTEGPAGWFAFAAYLMYSCAYVVTNGVLFYLYKFVIGEPGHFWVVGVIATIVGFFVSPLFPIFNKYVPRKWLFTIGQCCMVAAYLIFIFGRSNIYVMDLGLVLFNINCAQLVTVLTLTDAIEYGQLKSGQRNEAVVLAVRPMIDKLTGAISNGLVGWIALACGMTGSATAADMTAKSIRTFDGMAFYIPMVLALLSIVIFLSKVTLSEKKHAQVVEELKNELAAGNGAEAVEDVSAAQTTLTLLAPVDGKVVDLASVTNEDGTKGFPGKGFAIKPADGRIYAPFDGTIKFAFSTQHAFEIESAAGIGLVVHVGIGTVNMRGAGFNIHFQEGQTVHAGDLLMEFNRDLILPSGYDDIVVDFLTQPQKVQLQELRLGDKVEHGQPIAKAEYKK